MGHLKDPDGVLLGPQWGPIWARRFINDFLILFSSINDKPHHTFLCLSWVSSFTGPFLGPLGPSWGPFPGPFWAPPGPGIHNNCYPSYHLTLALRKF
jgi:hypothetical protein